MNGVLKVATEALKAPLPWCDLFLWTPETWRCPQSNERLVFRVGGSVACSIVLRCFKILFSVCVCLFLCVWFGWEAKLVY